MDIYLVKGETVNLVIEPKDSRDKGWVFGDDITDVIFTIRETETADALLQLHGEVEYKGTSVDDGGTVSIPIHSADTKDLAVGEYYYDVVLVQTGHWFDIEDTTGLYCKIGYGKIKDDDGNWLEINAGWIELTDNEINFVQITKEGEYKVTTGDYEKVESEYVNYNLYRIITLDSEIITVFPYDDWFAQGIHSGLNFVYEAGKVLTANNELIDVEAGYITLKPDITNYIEVSPAGVVSSNITKFTEGSYPLYIVQTATDSIEGQHIETVTPQSNSFIFDDRNKFVRGDSYIPSVKAKCTITWTPTKTE